jgi:hypothetical protein
MARRLTVLTVMLLTIAVIAVAVLTQTNSQRSSAWFAGSAPADGANTVIASAGNPSPAAMFEGNTTTLLLPKRYREWVFVGSSLGLRYKESPGDTFNHVYIDPVAYKEYAKTGQFPEGTVMILETVTQEKKEEPHLTGIIEGEFVELEASVKNSVKFPKEGWAYYSFGDPAKPDETATPFSSDLDPCWKCHKDNAASKDFVFTQFYPVLRAAHGQ